MLPAFQSTRSALAFSLLLITLLCLPLIVYGLGLPSREQTWSGVPEHVGSVGDVVHTIFEDPRDADIVFLGPSLVRRAIDRNLLEQALSQRLGRPAEVASLSMSWAGADAQYFMLRDYLEHHHPRLIVWDAPGRVSSSGEAHVQAYRWMRFGEFQDTFADLPMLFRIQAYGAMVLGAPKQLLYKVRSNLLSAEERRDREGYDIHLSLHTGYHNTPFLSDTLPGAIPSAQLLPVTSPLLYLQKPVPNVFERKYMRQIVALAASHHCKLVLLHIPTDLEFGDAGIPEVADWTTVVGPNSQEIGIPAKTLFAGLDRDRYLHFFSDGHLNTNGREVFTKAILPAVLEADREAESPR